MAVTINGTSGITNVNGTAAAPAITGTDTDSGVYFGTNTVGLATAGLNAVYVDASQNVGIGTSSPAQKLDVVGAINSTRAGNENYFLTDSSSSTRSSLQQNGNNLYFNANDNTATAGGFIWRSSNASTERMRIDSSGNLQFNSGYGSVATAYGCRAWVNFSASTGSPVIAASGNVTSITDNGTGNFTVVFTNAMPDANYVIQGAIFQTGNSGAQSVTGGTGYAFAAGSCHFFTRSSSAAYDPDVVCVSFNR